MNTQPDSVSIGIRGGYQVKSRYWPIYVAAVLDRDGNVFEQREFTNVANAVAWARSWAPLPVIDLEPD